MRKFLLGLFVGVVLARWCGACPTVPTFYPPFHPRVGPAPTLRVKVRVKEPSLDELAELGFRVHKQEEPQ